MKPFDPKTATRVRFVRPPVAQPREHMPETAMKCGAACGKGGCWSPCARDMHRCNGEHRCITHLHD